MENKKNYFENEKNIAYKKVDSDKIILPIISLLSIFTLLGEFIGQFDSSWPISWVLKTIWMIPFISINNWWIFELFWAGLLIVLIWKIHKNHSFHIILIALILLFLMHFYMNWLITDQNITFLRYNPIFQK